MYFGHGLADTDWQRNASYGLKKAREKQGKMRQKQRTRKSKKSSKRKEKEVIQR